MVEDNTEFSNQEILRWRRKRTWPHAAITAWLTVFLASSTDQSAIADTIELTSAYAEPGESIVVPIGFENTSQVVGMQFELVYNSRQFLVGSPIATSETTNHEATSRDFGGYRRVVVNSLSNSPLPSDLILDIPVSPQSPAGGGVVGFTIRNIIFTDANGNQIAPSVIYKDTASWLDAHFTAAEQLDPAISGDDADPDKDGLVNLWELLTGGDPRSAERGKEPKPGFDGASAELTLTFEQAKNTAELDVDFEKSEDLKIWTPATIDIEPTGSETALTVEMKARFDSTSAARQFIRMTLRRRPTP